MSTLPITMALLHSTTLSQLKNDLMALALISAGADVNKATKNGATPLHLASHRNRLALAKVMVEFGAKVNATDNEDDTVLHKAARKNKVEWVEFLLNHNASFSVKNKDGWSPYEYALMNSGPVGVKLILDKGANVNDCFGDASPLYLVAKEGDVGVVAMLLGMGADVDFRFSLDGSTPLHAAASSGSTPKINALLRRGADPQAKMNSDVSEFSEYTPSMVATYFENHDAQREIDEWIRLHS